MSAPDWRDLPAGRELDAIVAELVMGWGWLTNDRPEVLPRARWLAPPEELIEAGHIRHADMSEPAEDAWWLLDGHPFDTTVPRYSTDIAAAWELFAVLGGIVTLKRMGADNAWYCGFGEGINAWADTAPHATCLAALTAVTREVQP